MNSIIGSFGVDLQNCGDKSMITFSKTTVKAFVLESGVQLFQHPMESISFASLGEGVSIRQNGLGKGKWEIEKVVFFGVSANGRVKLTMGYIILLQQNLSFVIRLLKLKIM